MAKCVILAGGKGTRLSEETELIPKPSIYVGDKPLIHHIIDSYLPHSQEFVIAVGYKAYILVGYFTNLEDVKVHKSNGLVQVECKEWKVSLIDTGMDTMTGGRLKRLEKYLSEPFYFTYGDGLSDVDVRKSMQDLETNRSVVTLTAVRPVPRFGSILADKDGKVLEFGEKGENLGGWINGGFASMSPEIFSKIHTDSDNLEKDIYPQIVKEEKLRAVFHDGFWKCCDTKRDLEELSEIYKMQGAVWLK